MKTGLYIKTILTVIAVCMIINIFDRAGFLPLDKASANTAAAVESVQTTYPIKPNYDGSINVKIIEVNTSSSYPLSVKFDGTPTVKMEGTPTVKISN